MSANVGNMDDGYATGYPLDQAPQQDVKNFENDRPPGSWSFWEIVSGKRDKAQGFRGRGWKTAPFVFLGVFGLTTSSFGLEFNIVNYFLLVLNMPLAKAATIATNFIGASYVATLLGAFLADAFLGRFLTFVFGSFFFLAGMVVFTIQAQDPSLRPELCNPLNPPCQMLSTQQMSILGAALALLAVGSGGFLPCEGPFGADQFDRSNKRQMSQLRHYFNWYYFSFGFAMLTASTVIIYVQDGDNLLHFGRGGIICVILLTIAIIAFLCGWPYYIHMPPTGSPLTKMVQVVVAAVRKWKRTLPENPENLYEGRKFDDKENLGIQLELLEHTDTFRFLDKAAILEEVEEVPDSRRYSPWRLAPVQRVEELKTMLRILPIWLASIPVCLITIQRGIFISQQALTMDTKLLAIKIPPASMVVFSIATVLVFIPLYDLWIIKVLRKFTGHPKGISDLQRIGVGIFLNVLTAIVMALVEMKRRKAAFRSHNETLPLFLGVGAVHMSVLWLVPQLVLTGLTELFVFIGLLEFYYDQAPESLRSMSNALFWTSLGVGAFLNSLVINVIQDLTVKPACLKEVTGSPFPPQCGWVQSNVKLGHLDYFYWFIAVVTVLNVIYFLAVSRWYVYKKIRDSPLEPQDIDTPPERLEQVQPCKVVKALKWSVGLSTGDPTGEQSEGG